MTGARHADLAWAESEGDGEKMAEVERGSVALVMNVAFRGHGECGKGPRASTRVAACDGMWTRAKTEVRFKAVGVATRRVRQPPA